MAGSLSKESFRSSGFPGEITAAYFEEKPNYNSEGTYEQLHVEIRPLNFKASGAKGTGVMHDWWKKGGKNSLLYKQVENLEKVGVVVNEPEELVGLCFYWESQTIVLGKNTKTGETFKKDDVRVPTRLLTKEEVEAIKSEAATRASQPTAPAATATASVAPTTTFSDETLYSVAAVLYGKPKAAAITAVAGAGLGTEVVQALLANKLVPLLKEKGLLKEEDGVYAAA